MIEGLSNVRISSESFSLVFPPACSGNPPMETTICAGKASVGELFGDSLVAISRYVRNAPGFQGFGPKFPVCSVRFSDSDINAGGGLESVTPQFVLSGSVVHDLEGSSLWERC